MNGSAMAGEVLGIRKGHDVRRNLAQCSLVVFDDVNAAKEGLD